MSLYFDTLSGTYGDTRSLVIIDDDFEDASVHVFDHVSHVDACRYALTVGKFLEDSNA